MSNSFGALNYENTVYDGVSGNSPNVANEEVVINASDSDDEVDEHIVCDKPPSAKVTFPGASTPNMEVSS